MAIIATATMIMMAKLMTTTMMRMVMMRMEMMGEIYGGMLVGK